MDSLTRRSFLQGAGIAMAACAVPGLVLRDGRLVPAETLAASLPPTHEQMKSVLVTALSRGGTYADLYLETRHTTQINIAESEVTGVEYGVIQGGGVHVVAGEKTGYAFAESLNTKDLAECAQTAAQIADSSGPQVEIAGPLCVKTFNKYVTCSQPIGDATITKKIDLLMRIDAAARSVSPHITQVTISLSDTVQNFTIASSEGHLHKDELPMIYLRVNAYASRGDDSAEGRFRTSARLGMEFFADQMPEESGRQAAEQAMRMLDAKPAPSGEFPVVIAAGGGVMFHEAVGHGLEADAVLQGSTVFANRVGEKVASDMVTLYDGGSFSERRGSFNIDDEGISARKTCLIENGILKGYMHNQRTAKSMKTAPTGNGRRQSFRYPAIPRMSNTYVTAGDLAPEEIINQTSKGIYAVSFGGGEVDTASGQFTFGLREAYLIENGKVTTPLRGANLVGSGPEVLQRIDLVGSDFAGWPGTCGKAGQWVPVTSYCPTLRVSRITVGGTA